MQAELNIKKCNENFQVLGLISVDTSLIGNGSLIYSRNKFEARYPALKWHISSACGKARQQGCDHNNFLPCAEYASWRRKLRCERLITDQCADGEMKSSGRLTDVNNTQNEKA